MRYTKERLLEEACVWAYKHQTLCIDDDEFLPLIEAQGVTGAEINRFKGMLEHGGSIKNHPVVGGFRDFDLAPAVFRSYLKRVLPSENLAKAQSLHEQWRRSPGGPFSSSVFVQQLGVSEAEALYLLDVVQHGIARP